MAFSNQVLYVSQLIADKVIGAFIGTADPPNPRWEIDNVPKDGVLGPGSTMLQIRGYPDSTIAQPTYLDSYTTTPTDFGTILTSPTDVAGTESSLALSRSIGGSPSSEASIHADLVLLQGDSTVDANAPSVQINGSGNSFLLNAAGALLQTLAGDPISLFANGVAWLRAVAGDVKLSSDAAQALINAGTHIIANAQQQLNLGAGTSGWFDAITTLRLSGHQSVTIDNFGTAGGDILVEATDGLTLQADGVSGLALNTTDAAGDIVATAADIMSIKGNNASGTPSTVTMKNNITMNAPTGVIDASNNTLRIVGGTLDISGDNISKFRAGTTVVSITAGNSTGTQSVNHGQGTTPDVVVATAANGVIGYYANVDTYNSTAISLRASQRDGTAGAASVTVNWIAIWF